ncbi:DUF805 domain-containing protein [Bradyrhizobium sp. AUGA SZCCT0169]|jgi:uncharacterized membrane protein YhaH (DUF805 family)|uniref:DUF805 domain-containing protein n=1 Tax=Bradyrhizobium sp. AUGA SZCCT0169 TaxID=2807663 RepID=UPI001BA6AFEF|nr:DUF805 domain-containing protein [Bradyrhizobium sp. AUGA SZCCT0169]MBR1249872.1 DUF805 domain-containing protein [Bradyrhizobium sp. AUGA SZCCT0169]
MDYVWYLFSFEGRINRAKCWLAVLIVISWMIFLGLTLMGIAHLFGAELPSKLSFSTEQIFYVVDPEAWRSLSSTNRTSLLIYVIGTPLFLWVYLATSVKRLHDRNKSGWWMLLFFVMPGLYSQFGNRLEALLDDSYFAIPLSLNAFVFTVWGFVELYCLKGTTGTNAYGADPLAPVDMRPAWDQQSEIEMVPHKAGPPPVWRVKPGYE